MQVTQVVKTEATLSGPYIQSSLVAQSPAGTSPKKPFDWHDKKCVPNDQRIVKVDYECLSGQCGWCYNLRGKQQQAVRDDCARRFPPSQTEPVKIGHFTIQLPVKYLGCVQQGIRPGMEYLADYDIEEGGVCVTAYRHCDGENTTNFAYQIFSQQLKPGYKTVTSDFIDLEYGKDIIFNLDPANSDCSFVVSGDISTTNQTFNLDHNTATTGKVLKLKGIAKVGEACRATFALLP